MSKLQDLKKSVATVLATVHPDVAKYVTALEDKVQSNRNVWIGSAAGVAVILLLLLVHHLKHG